jgi:hypothetical protein
MKEYKIFKHPSGASEAVKEGWSWPAFFFSYIWAMVKKQWALGVGVPVGVLVFWFIVDATRDGSFAAALISIVLIIIDIIFGIEGNSWREKNLISRGYELADTVTASNPEDAIALYLKSANATR